MNYQPARRVAIIGSSRIPFARAHTAYAESSNQEMMTAVLQNLTSKYKLQGARIDDVSLGAVIKHSRDWNLARECVLGTDLSPTSPAFDLQRACGTSLEAAVLIGNKIALGQIDSGIAAGTDSISDAPIVFKDAFRRILLSSARGRSFGEKLKPWLGLRPKYLAPDLPGVVEPRTGLSMGESTELTAKEWGITREAQDELAYTSHHRAAAAWDDGFFNDLVFAFNGLTQDNNVRRDTSMEKLGKLRPAFDKTAAGTMTAGNSTPLTDGSAAVLLASEDWAAERGLPVQAYLRYGKVAAVDFIQRDGLLMAPAFAVSEMLQDADLSFVDFDFFEIHEAFAAQTLATLAAWESADFCRDRLGRDTPLGAVDRDKLNVRGGSLAIGHPFAATGARIIGGLAHMLEERGQGRGLISVCTAGGMGVTAIVER